MKACGIWSGFRCVVLCFKGLMPLCSDPQSSLSAVIPSAETDKASSRNATAVVYDKTIQVQLD